MALPKTSGDFVWVQESWGTALRCGPLSNLSPHFFSTVELSLDGADNPAAWGLVADALGIAASGLVRMRQVHGAAIYEARSGTTVSAVYEQWPEADIAIASDPSFGLIVRTADCVPILLADSRTGAVAGVHAGWRGTAAGAVIAAVRALEWEYGVHPANLVAAVGPSIGKCCYEVGGELADDFADHPDSPRWFDTRTGRPRLNLWQATRDQLERAGVPSRNIHVCELCTADHPQLFHSYRRDGARAGRLVAAIRSAPGTTL